MEHCRDRLVCPSVFKIYYSQIHNEGLSMGDVN